MEKLVICLLLAIVMGSLVLSAQAMGNEARVAAILRGKLVDYGAAWNSSDAEELKNFFTENARFAPPGAPIVFGRENIVAAITARQVQLPTVIVTNDATIVRGNKLAMQQNSFVNYDDNGDALFVGKGINVWVKEDGDWKLEWLTFNSDAPCQCP